MLKNFLSGTYGTNNTAGKILKEVCPTCTFLRKIQKGCLFKGRKHSADSRDSYGNRSVNDKTNIQKVHSKLTTCQVPDWLCRRAVQRSLS